MVHLRVVPDDRRERSREARKRAFLDATQAVLEVEGLDGITMQAVADELDCAVGTIYSYYPSKSALLTALRARAVDTLRASFATARPRWEELLDAEDLPESLRSLIGLVGFGSFWSAAAVVFADEFELARQLLSTKVTLLDADGVADVLPLLELLLAHPVELHDAAVGAGALQSGDGRERALRWVAALNGVLLLEHLAPADRHRFRASHLARSLTLDLLVGWGAGRDDLEVAAGHVERLAAHGPMAPPPEVPPFV